MSVVRQNPDFEKPRPEETAAALGPDADRRLERFAAVIDSLFERPPGRPSLLDWRLIPDAAFGRVPHEHGVAWGRGVMEVLQSGYDLDEAIPETVEAAPLRHALYAVMDAVRYEEKEDLRDLRSEWARVRGDLRRFVLGLAREDDPEDVRALGRAIGACGLRPLSQPEPSRVGAALRRALKALLDGAGRGQVRNELRHALDRLGARSVPRVARFILAVKLAERPAARPDLEVGGEVLEERAFLADPSPARRPHLPAPLVGSVLLLLAALDVAEARRSPRSTWRGRSAYNVLRRVAGEVRWGEELRVAMDTVVEGLIDEKEIEYILAVVAQVVLCSASRATTGVATKPPARVDGPQSPRSSALEPDEGMEGSVATDRVSSPPPSSRRITTGGAQAVVAEGSAGGDETGALEPASEAGVAGVSSPLAPAKAVAAGGPSSTDSGRGDGTETSEAASQAGLAEVSSRGGPAERATGTAEDGESTPTVAGTGDGAGSPRSASGTRQRVTPPLPEPESLALAYLMRAVREGHRVPSRTECAMAAGVTKQATMKWASFSAVWRNARASQKGHVRRGYRDVRTGDVESEADDG